MKRLLAGLRSRPCSPRRRRRRTSRCSTCPTIRRASSTTTSTRPSPPTGRPRPATTVTIKQSHGGSGKQARAVIDGLEADVVTLALAYDIDAIAETPRADRHGLADAAAATTSSPYTSTIVFLVRKGNPKSIKDWDDLVKPGVAGHHAQSEDLGRRALELPGRLGLCARRTGTGGRRGKARELRRAALQERAGARLRRARLDHHLRPARHRRRADRLGERGAALASSEFGKDKFEIVVPSVSILAEPPVAVVDKVVDQQGHARGRRGLPATTSTRPRARRSPPSISTGRATRRPWRRKHAEAFPKMTLFTIDEVFGGWRKAQKAHFADGGVFDQIYGQ